jgi:predicted lipoprotein with Yx(FWY)xxD motif
MRPTVRPTRIGFLTAIGGLALVLAACSSSGSSSAPSAAAPSAAPTTAASAAASAVAGGGGALTLATGTGPVGTYLTGVDGKTLYIFTKDSANKSVCVDACATKWPPVIITGSAPAAPAGVTGALTTFARPDGSMQLAINGLPLYYYAPDTKGGDTTGQGVGGVWFIATPDGVLPSAAPSAATIGY